MVKKSVALVLGILSSFLWATYYPFINLSKASLYYIVSLPFLIGGIVFLVYAKYKNLIYSELKKFTFFDIIIISFLAFFMQYSIVIANGKIGSVDTSLFVFLGDGIVIPSIALVAKIDSKKKKMNFFLPGAVVLIVGGLLIISNGFDVHLLYNNSLYGLFATFSMSAYFLLTQYKFKESINITFLGTSFIITSIIALCFGSIYSPFSVPTINELVFLLVVGLTSFFIAYYFFFISSSSLGIATITFLQALIPVFTTIFMFELGNSVTFYQILGIAVTIIGTVIISKSV
ncbi:MAG: EamA family transporter [Thermoplasmata archaeon]